MSLPLSVIICTYNGGNLLRKCLDSVFMQDFKNFEVICVDGGSTDGTIELIEEYKNKYKNIKIIKNKMKLPEGKGFGKWLGFKEVRGQVVGIIDQDNTLQKNTFFSTVLNIFSKHKEVFAVSGGLKHDLNDLKVVRYISMFGTDSFLAYRSIDALLGRSIGVEKFEKFYLKPDNILIVGSNCLFYSKKNVSEVGGYEQDVLTNKKIVESGKSLLFVIKNATKHYSEKNIYRLIKKKFMWGAKYFTSKKNEDRFCYFPDSVIERKEFYKNLIYSLLFFPNIEYSIKAFKSTRDIIAFIFPYLAFLNLLAYALSFLIGTIRNK